MKTNPDGPAWVPVVRAETCDPDILKRAIATYNEMQDIKEKAELAINDPLRDRSVSGSIRLSLNQ